jgi:two-component system C4-dicarboxylate transport sensor histidine kinase DctB
MPDQSPGFRSDEFLEQVRGVDTTGWRLFLFSDLQSVERYALSVATTSGLALGVAILLALYLHQRQRVFAQTAAAKEALQDAHDRLEQEVAERTADLVKANEQLHQEIAERNRAAAVLRETQAGLVHAEKLAALGQMSAGITHELNQPLTALQTLSDNARVLLERNRIPEATANLSTISELAQRMGEVVAHWKQIARKSHPSISIVSIKTVVSNALLIANQQIKSRGIKITKSFGFEDLTVRCDPNRLEQILINLLSNAIDAVTQAPRPEIYVSVSRHEDRAMICVRDNGAGIPEEVMPRLFEPFFTTKEAGSGLGLGLAISSELAREMNGTITAHNRSQGGAEFILVLPIASPEAHHA